MPPLRVVALISGRGSNLKRLIDAAGPYSIVGVVSNKSDAPGLAFAEATEIPTAVVQRAQFQTPTEYRNHLATVVASFTPALVVLAGFMELIKEPFLSRFPNQIINIHPSILPAYPGLDTHARVIADLQNSTSAPDSLVHGCTVHLVDDGMDTGPIIAQAICEVHTDDTPETLSARVNTYEHRLYPWVVTEIASGAISLNNAKIIVSPEAHTRAKLHGFLIP